MSLKILLVNSPWVNNDSEYGVKAGTRWAAIRKKDQAMPYFPFPYLLACATAVLKESGFAAQIKDAIAEEVSREECLQYIEKEKPQVLVSEAFTPSIFVDLEFMKEAKKRVQSVNILSGIHPTALPEEMLKNEFIDFVLIGEYDYTLRELIQFLDSGRKDFDKISGLAFRQDGLIKINPRREPIKNLDELPFPVRDELPMYKYNEPFSKYYPTAKIVSSRGCSYQCIFCTEQLMYGPSIYRYRSISNVLEEIRLLKDKYKIREIFFDDSIFTIPRAKQIAGALVEERLNIAWSCWMDWNISFEDLRLLKKSGCIGIKFGVESASPEILDLAKKPVNLDKIKELIKNCRKLGLFCSGAFMFGLPGETKDTLEKTLALIFSLKITSCQLSIATPLPGTPFNRLAKEKGWLLTEDWNKYDCHYTSVVEYPDCKKEDIESAIALARKRKVMQVLRNPYVALSYFIKLWKLKGSRGLASEIMKKSSFILKAILSKK